MVTSKLSKTGSKSEINLLSNKYVQHKNGLKSCLIAPVTDNMYIKPSISGFEKLNPAIKARVVSIF